MTTELRTPKPAEEFERWTHVNLARFASEATGEIIALEAQVKQLRMDLRDAMQLIREMNRA